MRHTFSSDTFYSIAYLPLNYIIKPLCTFSYLPHYKFSNSKIFIIAPHFFSKLGNLGQSYIIKCIRANVF